VDLRERWNFLDQFMPLHSAKSRLYGERYPSKSLMDKDHKLMASISSGDSVWKMIASVTSQVTQATQRRGILIWPVEPYDSDDECVRQSKASSLFFISFYFYWKYIGSHWPLVNHGNHLTNCYSCA
jgi:hypothetical protein